MSNIIIPSTNSLVDFSIIAITMDMAAAQIKIINITSLSWAKNFANLLCFFSPVNLFAPFVISFCLAFSLVSPYSVVFTLFRTLSLSML